MWLRNVFPFELLSSSDSFVFTSDDKSSTLDPVSLFSSASQSGDFGSSVGGTGEFLPSGLQDGHKLDPVLKTNQSSTISVMALSSSPDIDINRDIEQGSLSPSATENNDTQGCSSPAGVDQSLKITGLSTLSRPDSVATSVQSSCNSPKGPKFKIFNKFKSVRNTNRPYITDTDSPIHVYSSSSSSKTNSSNSVQSILNGLKSHLKIGSSSSSKESSSHSAVSTPVALLDITKVSDDTQNSDSKDSNNDLSKKQTGSMTSRSERGVCPKLVGSDVRMLDQSEIKVTQNMESTDSQGRKKREQCMSK